MRIDESRTAVKYTPGRQGRKVKDIVRTWTGESAPSAPELRLLRLPRWCRRPRNTYVSRCASVELSIGRRTCGHCAPRIHFQGLPHAGAARFQNAWPNASATALRMNGSGRCDRLPSLPGLVQHTVRMRLDAPSRDGHWKRLFHNLSRCSCQSIRGMSLAALIGPLRPPLGWRSAPGHRQRFHASVLAGSASSNIQRSGQGERIQGHRIHLLSYQ